MQQGERKSAKRDSSNATAQSPSCGCADYMSPSQLCASHKKQRARILGRRRARKKRHGNPNPDLQLSPEQTRATLDAFDRLTRAEQQLRAELQEHGLRPAPRIQAILDASRNLRGTLEPALAEAHQEHVEDRRGKIPGR